MDDATRKALLKEGRQLVRGLKAIEEDVNEWMVKVEAAKPEAPVTPETPPVVEPKPRRSIFAEDD